MFGYLNQVGLLWRYGRYDEMDARAGGQRSPTAATRSTRPTSRACASYRYGLQAMRGDWDGRRGGPARPIVGSGEDPGLLARHALARPWPGSRSAAARRRRALLAAAREHAERAENLPVLLARAAAAEVELGVARPAARAAARARALLPRTEQPGRAWQRGRAAALPEAAR